jgi:uncharacterized protein YdeI (YjbR/CyaY-like superfamily)
VVGPCYFDSAAEFRKWLEEHHDSESELTVGFYKKASGRGGMAYPESVDEGLCFGWIDGVRKGTGEHSYSIRFSPRRPTSTWSLVNVRRFNELKDSGRVAPAGQAAFDARREDRTGIYSAEQPDDIALPAHFTVRFKESPQAWNFWQSAPKSYRKAATWWVISAKREETKASRLETLIECSARGVKIPPLRRPGDPA